MTGCSYADLYNAVNDSFADANQENSSDGVSITYRVVGEEKPNQEDMDDTIVKLQKRAESFSKDAVVYQEGVDRIHIKIPGVSDSNTILQELGKPGALYFIAETNSEGNLNYEMQEMSFDDGTFGYEYVLNKSLEELQEDGSIVLEGTDVKSATAGTAQDSMQNSMYVVDLVMTDEGREKLKNATANAYSKGESLAIYCDGIFISVPRVMGVFTDGQVQISPMESYEAAQYLASVIRIGRLQLELQLEEFKANHVDG